MNKGNLAKTMLVGMLVLLLVAVSLMWGCAKPVPAPVPPKPAFKMPDPLVCTSNDVGSAMYIMSAAIGDAMRKAKGITLRVVPAGTTTGRLSLVVSGRTQFAFIGHDGVWYGQEGLEEFARLDWGPQPLQLIKAGMSSGGMGYLTAKDANIKTWADTKGKRFASIPGHPGCNVLGEACLAFGGLTWSDVKKVECPSYGAAGKAVVDGKCDAACGATYAAWVYELAASPRGVYFPPMPHDDKEGWKRMQSVFPILVPIKATVGAGLSEDKPVDFASYPNPSIIVLEQTDEELAYQLAKMLCELHDVYKLVNLPGMEQFALDRSVFEMVTPYHKGAVRYYKEIGVWTDKHQKNNDLMVKRQRLLKEAWNKAVAEAADQKVEEKNFPKFWMDIRSRSLQAAG